MNWVEAVMVGVIVGGVAVNVLLWQKAERLLARAQANNSEALERVEVMKSLLTIDRWVRTGRGG